VPSLFPQEKPGRPVVCEEKRVKLKWPKSNKTSEWERLDDDLDKILENVLSGAADRKIHCMTAIIYNMALERFGE
jgi:hypothetical protein